MFWLSVLSRRESGRVRSVVAKEWNERNVSLGSECVTEYEAKVRRQRQSSAGRWEGKVVMLE